MKEYNDGGNANDHDRHSHTGDAQCPMKMYFHGGTDEVVLFSFWKSTTIMSMIFSCCAVFIVAVLYEGLKAYREWLFRKRRQRLEVRELAGAVNLSVKETPTSAQTWPASRRPVLPYSDASATGYRRLSPLHLYQTFLHMLQVTISFMLMLIFMTFNVWLCLATILGAGLGYFIFSLYGNTGTQEHCN